MVNKYEVAWTLAVVVLITGVGVYSTILVYHLDALPSDPTEYVDVIGHQWYWEFCYSNRTPDHCVNSSYDAATNTVSGGALWAPPGAEIQVNITSLDVAHSFYIPQLGVQINAIPGRENYFAFSVPNAAAGTEYVIECLEFCGAFHGTMRSFLVIT
jgi:heme/copper-type cytochrome/quinol oxidase subunit 2